MKTYLRVLRYLKPYLPQVGLSMLFMVVFSLLNSFGIVMIGPFLDALFAPEPVAVEAAAPDRDSRLVLPGASAPAVDDAAARSAPAGEAVVEGPGGARERVLGLRESFSLDGLRDRLYAKLKGFLMSDSKRDSLWRIVVISFFLFMIKNLSGYLQTIFTDYVQHSFIRDLRNQLFDRYMALPLSFHTRQRAGELISRATNDVLVVNRSVNMSFTNLARDPITIVAFLGLALLLSWRLTLIGLVVLPLSMAIIVQIGRKLRKYSHRQQEKMANLTSILQETISGVRVVKAFAMERYETARFREESQRLFRAVFKMAWMERLSSPLTEQLSILVGLFILWYGGNQVLAGGQLPPSLFILFLFCIFSLGRPIKALSQVNNGIQEGMAAAERIFAVLDHPEEVPEAPDAPDLEDVRGAIELQDVHFAYLDGEPVLQGVSLKAAPGEMVALVGSSGAGKSTLVDLIPRFYDPQRGRVLVDGRDVREVSLQSLRRSMGVVTQEVILFNDTVGRNIAYGMGEVPAESVEAAARAANAHDFIMRLPRGYDTMIGDRGVRLSGGERQRLSIARAILKNPPILILDEATSALDTESELLVQEAIDRLVRDRTTIVIAHRLSTIQNVDRIHVMQRGRVVQTGTHAELLAAGGPYKILYDLQFRA